MRLLNMLLKRRSPRIGSIWVWLFSARGKVISGLCRTLVLAVLASAPPFLSAQQVTIPDGKVPLSAEIEDLKQTVLDLNRDLLMLEEELLFPANTQVSVFVSMDVGEFFQLDALKLKIDNKLVASHLYTKRQVDALYRGGVQRLYVGNLASGAHEISAIFTGIGPEGRQYRRASKMMLEKDQSTAMIELSIVDSERKLQPVFDIKEWQP